MNAELYTALWYRVLTLSQGLLFTPQVLDRVRRELERELANLYCNFQPFSASFYHSSE